MLFWDNQLHWLFSCISMLRHVLSLTYYCVCGIMSINRKDTPKIFWKSESDETLTCAPVSCRWPATTHTNWRAFRLQLQEGYAQVEPKKIRGAGRGNFHLHSVSYNTVDCDGNRFIICRPVYSRNILARVVDSHLFLDVVVKNKGKRCDFHCIIGWKKDFLVVCTISGELWWWFWCISVSQV